VEQPPQARQTKRKDRQKTKDGSRLRLASGCSSDLLPAD
jgi:hypothetical protein